MGRLHWIAIDACVLTAAYVVQEPLLRPDKATVLSWMNGRDITVVPVADNQRPTLEKIDSARVRDLKHESGIISRSRFWFPKFGWAIYTFRYPYRGELNSYRVQINYAYWLRLGSILRKPESVTISGPDNAGNQ